MKFVIDKHVTQKFLNEEDLLPCEGYCVLCNSIKRFKIFELQKNPQIDLLECDECHIVSASRIPKEEVLGKVYSEFYERSYYGLNKEKVTMDNYIRLSKHIKKRIPISDSTEELYILDFGGGDGSISCYLSKLINNKKNLKKIHIDVVDYEAYDRQVDQKIKVKGFKDLSELPFNRKYNIVVASAIMEHLPNPRNVFHILLKLLEENGFYYARTPYFIPFMKFIQKFGVEAEFIYPIHLHDMGAEFWNKIIYSLDLDVNEYEIISSQPSLIESDFTKRFFFTLLALIFKAPWYFLYFDFLRRNYKLVGGWEVFIRRKSVVT